MSYNKFNGIEKWIGVLLVWCGMGFIWLNGVRTRYGHGTQCPNTTRQYHNTFIFHISLPMYDCFLSQRDNRLIALTYYMKTTTPSGSYNDGVVLML